MTLGLFSENLWGRLSSMSVHKCVKFHDRSLNGSREIPPEVVGGWSVLQRLEVFHPSLSLLCPSPTIEAQFLSFMGLSGLLNIP